MAKTRDYMDYLDEHIGIAPVSSQEEYQAAETIADVMRDHGLEANIEEFDAHPTSTLAMCILTIVLVICLTITGLTEGAVHIITLVLAIVSVGIMLASHYLRNPFEGMGPAARSQNVVAVHRAEGPNVQRGARPIVIVAHYDTPRESLLRKGPLVHYAPMLPHLIVPLSIAVAVALLFQLFTFLPGFLRTLMWVIGLLCSLPMLFLAIVSIVDRHLNCTLGANDNKASVAAMLSILDKVHPADDRVLAEAEGRPVRKRNTDAPPAPPAPRQVQVVEEVKGVRHGAQILNSLGILPPSCEVVYEEPKVRVVQEPVTVAASVKDNNSTSIVDTIDEKPEPADEHSDTGVGEARPRRRTVSLLDEEDVSTKDDATTVDEERLLPASEEEASEPEDKESTRDEYRPSEDSEESKEDYDEEYEEDYDEEFSDEDYDEDYDEEYSEDEEGDEDNKPRGFFASIIAWFSNLISSIRERFSSKKDDDIDIERGRDRTQDDDYDDDYVGEYDEEYEGEEYDYDAEYEDEYDEDTDAEYEEDESSEDERDLVSDKEKANDSVEEDAHEEGRPANLPSIVPANIPSLEPVDEPVRESAIASVGEPTSASSVEPMLDASAIEPIRDQLSEPTTELATEPSVEPVSEPTDVSSVAPIAESAAEPEIAPVHESMDESVSDNPADSATPNENVQKADFEAYDDEVEYDDYADRTPEAPEPFDDDDLIDDREDLIAEEELYRTSKSPQPVAQNPQEDATPEKAPDVPSSNPLFENDELLTWDDEIPYPQHRNVGKVEPQPDEPQPVDTESAEPQSAESTPKNVADEASNASVTSYDDYDVEADGFDDISSNKEKADEGERFVSKTKPTADDSLEEGKPSEAYEDDAADEDDDYYEEEPYDEGVAVEPPSLGQRIKGFFRRLGGGEEEYENYEEDYYEDDEYYEEDLEEDSDLGYEEYEDDSELEEDEFEPEEDDPRQYSRRRANRVREDRYEEEYEDDDQYLEPYEDDIAEDRPDDDAYDSYEEDEEYDDYDDYEDDEPEERYEEDDYEEEEPLLTRPVDPNKLHFDREEDNDIVPRDTSGLDTISDSYDLYQGSPHRVDKRERPMPMEDPNWGVASYQPARPTINIARRAALYDLPDPSSRSIDPFDDEGKYGYEDEDAYAYAEDEAFADAYEGAAEDHRRTYAASSQDEYDVPNEEEPHDGGHDTKAYEQPRDWKGGATVRADLRDGEDGEPLVIDEADLQEAILELGDEFLVAHDIWFVATGASAADHAGMKAFLEQHRRDIRGSFLVNLDCIGAGDLSVLVKEGLRAPRRADRRLVRMLTDIARDLHIPLGTSVYDWDEKDAASAMRARVRAVTITGVDENGLPALSRTADDVPEYVVPDQVDSVVRLVTELIRRS